MRRGHHLLSVIVVCGLLAACGSTRPESDFIAAFGDPNLEGFTGSGATGSSTSNGRDGAQSSPDGDGSSAGAPDGKAGSRPGGGASDVERGAGQADGANTSSDVGVSASTIRVGNIVSRGGPLGPNLFTPSYFGANAYFEDLNAQGGVNGRTVEFMTCDDREESSQNRRCAESLIGQDVLAFVSNNSRVHFGGARLIDDAGVPDVGGQAIGYEYFKYPHLIPFYAHTFGHYPRNGTTGWDGTLYQADGPYRWVADQGIKKAAVLYYSIPISKSEGLNMASGLRNYGVEVVEFELNPALPGFDSIVAQMRSEGVEAIVNSIDGTGNQNLCTSMDRAGFEAKIHLLTVAGWTNSVGSEFSSPCRTNLYAFGWSLPTSVTSNAEVARFRDISSRVYGADFRGVDHQWAFEGWLAAKQFVQAVASMGPNVTRDGLLSWYRALDDYDLDGLISPGSYQPFRPTDGAAARSCLAVVRWNEGKGEFVMVEPPNHCLDSKWKAFEPVYEP